jgi:alpha-beta hydrolase superfamily lysophospholipase
MTTGKPMFLGDDIPFREVIRHLISTNPGRKIFLVGHSFGGTLVIKMLAEEFDEG